MTNIDWVLIIIIKFFVNLVFVRVACNLKNNLLNQLKAFN